MTADHPTREERRAMVLAVLEVHAGYEWWPMTREFICTCEASIGTSYPDAAHRAHVAAALVAADPAPAQPDAALSDDEAVSAVKALPTWMRDTEHGWSEVVSRNAVLRILAARAAQPVPAPEVSRGVAEAAVARVCAVLDAMGDPFDPKFLHPQTAGLMLQIRDALGGERGDGA